MNPVTGLALGRIGVGVLALAKPDLASRVLTSRADSDPLLTQWFGSREVALGAAALLTTGRARTTLVLLGMAVDAADAATSAQGLQAGTLPKAQAVPAIAVASGAVVAGALGLRVKRTTTVEVA